MLSRRFIARFPAHAIFAADSADAIRSVLLCDSRSHCFPAVGLRCSPLRTCVWLPCKAGLEESYLLMSQERSMLEHVQAYEHRSAARRPESCQSGSGQHIPQSHSSTRERCPARHVRTIFPVLRVTDSGPASCAAHRTSPETIG